MSKILTRLYSDKTLRGTQSNRRYPIYSNRIYFHNLKFFQKFKPVIITNLSHLIVSIANHSTIQNYCKCYNELIKMNMCSYDSKCIFSN